MEAACGRLGGVWRRLEASGGMWRRPGGVLEALAGAVEASERVLEALGGALEAEVRQDSAKKASRTPKNEKYRELPSGLSRSGRFLGALKAS